MNRLAGKVSIVTGSALGIGRSTALLFAKEGAKVVVADTITESGQETVNLIKAAGGESTFVLTDVSKATDVKIMVSKAIDTFGKLDVLCNNAGVFSVEPPLISDLSEEIWDRTIEVNLKSVYLCCKYALTELIKSGRGSIINISSIAAINRSPNFAYAASKGGVVALTKSLALQHAVYNIRANVICPGSVDTPGRNVSRQKRSYKGDLSIRLLKKEGQPEDIGYLAVYLASDESAFVTSQVFIVDGGSLRG